MIWRVMLLVDTDEAGAVEATREAKRCLAEQHGEVRSVTIAEHMFQAATRPLPRFREERPPFESEHMGTFKFRQRRND